MDNHLQSLDQVKSSAIDMAIKFGPKLVVALLILFAGYLAGRWVGRGFDRLLLRLKLDPSVRALLVRISHIVVIVLFGIMALQNLGVELVPLIAGLGVAGAGIALAMQGILGNTVAGLTIIFTRPFHVGDYISIAHEEGEVQDISLFSTTLGHYDRSKVVVLNRKIVGEILHNYGALRQLSLAVAVAYVAYDADVNLDLRLIDEIQHADARVLQDPAPVTILSRLADSSVTLSVKPWVKVPDYEAVMSATNRAILETFRARGIVIPFPQLEVRMPAGAA